ncbi:MAG: 30S ribosomal protein S16 [Candidatus Saccharibacteria bacterium]
MQRTGRKGHAQFRIVVQESRQTPSSARVVASIGTYNPHTKEVKVDSEKVTFYLKNGAQPSERVATLLKKEAVKLPSWVVLAKKEKKTTKNIDKLRKNRPAEKVAPAKEESIVAIDAETKDAIQETPIAEESVVKATVEAEAVPVVEAAVDKSTKVKPKEAPKEAK